jgi:hypothetical protein
MSIRRAPRPESNFYLLDKRISEDSRLSWGARGMLIFLLGKPDNWEVSVANLINETSGSAKKSGRDAVYAMLKELDQAGYLSRDKARTKVGEFGGVDYVVHESPLTEEPETANPYTGEPYTVNPTQVSTEGLVSNELEVSTDKPLPSSDELGAAFDGFWNAGMVKQAKAKSLAKFEQLCKTMGLSAEQLADKLIADIKARVAAGQFGFDRLHPLTYLNGKRWEDEVVRGKNVHAFPGRPRPKHTGLDQANDAGLQRRADGAYSL